jgi:hypothetical protein
VSVTHTVDWAGEVNVKVKVKDNHQFVVKLRTMTYVIEHLVRMKTHLGATTAVEAWTRVSLAVSLVLFVGAVKDSVTSQ